ncbi:radical SAM protein [Dubosiella newyorkensis]|uniref:radical SAM protein n=1 Tax=Dubosiella newyorkensis TaxID=1862672 RepID=UPI0032B18254
MKKIVRKTLLYKTGVEYGDYTINHVLGCSHGCHYPCYAFVMKKRFGIVKNYDEWCEPKIVSNAMELLRHEVPRLKEKINSVFLSFTTDPFMFGYQEVSDLSLEIIRYLNEHGIHCEILTKGILPTDLGTTSKDNSFGITVISLNQEYLDLVEPGAAPVIERILALKRLHNLGFKTWVSIEPYPTPNLIKQNILDVLNSISFVDKIIFGRQNYNRKVSEYKEFKRFYNEMACEVEKYCETNSIECHIKNKTKSI